MQECILNEYVLLYLVVCKVYRVYLTIDKSGIITTVNGLRIACLGGTYDPTIFGSAEAAPVRSFKYLHTLMFSLAKQTGIYVAVFLVSYN